MLNSFNLKNITKAGYFLICIGLGFWFRSPALFIISFALLLLIVFERQAKIKIPSSLGIIFTGFIICSLYLGSYLNFYERFLWWDDLLHAFYGGAFALIGFILINWLSNARGIQNDILIICLFSFCFAVAVGAIWEIYEYAFDSLTGGNMQRTDQGSGVTDTMNDIILESSTALIVNIYIYAYIKTGAQNWVGRIYENFRNTNS